MQTRITPDEIEAAARQLAKSDNGRHAMRRLLEWIESGDVDIGFLDQRAFLALLGGVWTGQKDKAGESIRAAFSAEHTSGQ